MIISDWALDPVHKLPSRVLIIGEAGGTLYSGPLESS